MFAFEPSESKKKLRDDLVLSGKWLVFAELLSGNNLKPSLIYDTSISDFKNKMLDNFSSNDCCYHIEDDGNKQFIEKIFRIALETAGKIEEKPSAKTQTIPGLWTVKIDYQHQTLFSYTS